MVKQARTMLYACILTLLVFSTESIANEYKYYKLEHLPFHGRIYYTDKKVNNDIAIELANGGCITIQGRILSYKEYADSRFMELHTSDGGVQSFTTIDVLGSRKEAQIVESGDGSCHVYMPEYHSGFALYIRYLGTKELDKYLIPTLKHLFVKADPMLAEQGAINMNEVKQLVAKCEIPLYWNSCSPIYVKKEMTQELSFTTTSSDQDVFDFYNNYFQLLGWKPYKSIYQYHVWVDPSEQLMLSLLLGANDQGTSRTTEVLKLYPFMQDFAGYCHMTGVGAARGVGPR